jgi:hypothetical protein
VSCTHREIPVQVSGATYHGIIFLVHPKPLHLFVVSSFLHFSQGKHSNCGTPIGNHSYVRTKIMLICTSKQSCSSICTSNLKNVLTGKILVSFVCLDRMVRSKTYESECVKMKSAHPNISLAKRNSQTFEIACDRSQ